MTIEHCRAEQKDAALYIIYGHPDQRGARQGLSDWFAEEFLMEQEHLMVPPSTHHARSPINSPSTTGENTNEMIDFQHVGA